MTQHYGGIMNKKLKILMIKKGVKNFDLAKHLNVDPSKISKILNGWIQPSDEIQNKIAVFFGVNKDSLWKRG